MPAMALLPRQSEDYQWAHPEEDQTRNLGGFYIVIVFITALCMFLRVLSRKITRLGIKRDDWFFLIGSTLAEGTFIVLLIYAFDAGLGKHWVFLTPEQKALFPKLNYAYNILNTACYPIIKISILLLYLRIFVTRRVQMFCWGGIAFLSCMCTANVLVSMFSCTPVRGFFDTSVPATCIDSVQFYWSTGIMNVVTDLYILILPIPVVWKLQTTLKRKIAISLIFAVGGLTFVISILRIVYYLDYTDTDPSYSFLGTAYATPAEVCLAIIVASAPTWRPAWTYTSNMALSIFSRSSGSSKTLSLAAAHSHSQHIVLGEYPKHKNSDAINDGSTTILRTPSTTRINSLDERKDSTNGQRRPSTTGRTAPSIARPGSNGETSLEVGPSQYL